MFSYAAQAELSASRLTRKTQVENHVAQDAAKLVDLATVQSNIPIEVLSARYPYHISHIAAVHGRRYHCWSSPETADSSRYKSGVCMSFQIKIWILVELHNLWLDHPSKKIFRLPALLAR